MSSNTKSKAIRFFLFSFTLLLFFHLNVSGQSVTAQLNDYLEQVRHDTGAPGIFVAVASKGKILFSDGLGYADLDNWVSATGTTVNNIGSVSKAISAVAVMQLVEQGKVSLRDHIQKYVLYFPEKRWPIKIWHILTHTSGIRHYKKGEFGPGHIKEMQHYESLKDAIKFFKEDPLLFKPGDFFQYSSYATNLLQGVVETASGMGFEEYLKNYVWEPAGMLSTALDVPERIVHRRGRGYEHKDGRLINTHYVDVSYKYLGGGIISSVEDLVRFGMALYNGKLLKPETLSLMTKVHIAEVMLYRGKDKPEKMSFQMALIWWIQKDVQGRQFIYHTGTVKGCRSCLLIYPHGDLVVALQANGLPFDSFKYTKAIAQMFLPPLSSDFK